MVSSGREFISRYRKDVIFASGPGCLFLPMLIIPAMFLLRNVFLVLIAAALSFLITTVIFNLVRRAKPALRLTDFGLEIDGLPRIAWGDVLSVRRDPNARGPAGLIVRLRRPWRGAQAVAARLAVTPVWRPIAEDQLLLRAGLLEDAIDETEDAFRFFLGR